MPPNTPPTTTTTTTTTTVNTPDDGALHGALGSSSVMNAAPLPPPDTDSPTNPLIAAITPAGGSTQGRRGERELGRLQLRLRSRHVVTRTLERGRSRRLGAHRIGSLRRRELRLLRVHGCLRLMNRLRVMQRRRRARVLDTCHVRARQVHLLLVFECGAFLVLLRGRNGRGVGRDLRRIGVRDSLVGSQLALRDTHLLRGIGRVLTRLRFGVGQRLLGVVRADSPALRRLGPTAPARLIMLAAQ